MNHARPLGEFLRRDYVLISFFAILFVSATRFSVLADDDNESEASTVLRPQSLGRIAPNQTSHFLLELIIPDSSGFSIKAIRKSCVCTKVELLSSPVMQESSQADFLVEVKGSSGRGRNVGQFDILLENESGSRKFAQPFEYYIADEIDFGENEFSQILVADGFKNSDFRIVNHTPEDWSRGLALFDFAGIETVKIAFDIQARKGLSQIVDFNVSSLASALQKRESIEGSLRLFAQNANDGQVTYKQVATRRVEIVRLKEMQISPTSIVLDKHSEQQILHIIASSKLPNIDLSRANVSCWCGEAAVNFRIVTRSPKWIDLHFEPDALRANANRELVVEVNSESVRKLRFHVPISE